MLNRSLRAAAVLVPAMAVAASVLVYGQTGVTNGEWPHWGGDQGNTKYSPLDQINRDNVGRLAIAWTWKGDSTERPAEYKN